MKKVEVIKMIVLKPGLFFLLFYLITFSVYAQPRFQVGLISHVYAGKNTYAAVGARMGIQFNLGNDRSILRLTSGYVFGHGDHGKFTRYDNYYTSSNGSSPSEIISGYGATTGGLSLAFYQFLNEGNVLDNGWFVGGGTGFTIINLTPDNKQASLNSSLSGNLFFCGDLFAGGGYYWSFENFDVFAMADLHFTVGSFMHQTLKKAEIPSGNPHPEFHVGISFALRWPGTFFWF